MASIETLMRQASMTAHEYMAEAIRSIDQLFGKGYAKANPQLVGDFIKTAAQDMDTMVNYKLETDVCEDAEEIKYEALRMGAINKAKRRKKEETS